MVYRPWDISIEGAELVCAISDPEAGWEFERRVRCAGDGLEFAFACTNTGSEPLHSSWVGHALIYPAAVVDLQIPRFSRVRQAYPPVVPDNLLPFRTPEEVWSHLKSIPMGNSIMMVLDGLDAHEFLLHTENLDRTWRISGIPQPALALWYNRRQYPQPAELSRDEFGIEWMTGHDCSLDADLDAGRALTVRQNDTAHWVTQWDIEEYV